MYVGHFKFPIAALQIHCSQEEEGEEGDWKAEEKDEQKNHPEELTDEEFDEALLVQDNRKSLKGLSPEAAREEVR